MAYSCYFSISCFSNVTERGSGMIPATNNSPLFLSLLVDMIIVSIAFLSIILEVPSIECISLLDYINSTLDS